MFTDHDISDSMDAVLASMQRLDDEREKLETHALAIEKELLAIMEQCKSIQKSVTSAHVYRSDRMGPKCQSQTVDRCD
jgi:hypothetical protein